MSNTSGAQPAATRPRPERAIASRRRDAAAKVAAVDKTVKAIGRTGVVVTRAGVARLAGVSRSFTYENHEADSIILAAQSRTQVRAAERAQYMTAQQEAAWKERALNAEHHLRGLRRELARQHQLVGDLLGRLREPDGTWIEDDSNPPSPGERSGSLRAEPASPGAQRTPSKTRRRPGQRLASQRAARHRTVS